MYLVISTATDLPTVTNGQLDSSQRPQLIHFSGLVVAHNGIIGERLETAVQTVGDAAPINASTSSIGVFSQNATPRVMAPEDVLAWFELRSQGATLIVGHDVHKDLEVLAATAASLDILWHTPAFMFSTSFGAVAIGLVRRSDLNSLIVADRLQLPSLAECFEAATGDRLQDATHVNSDAEASLRVYQYIQWRLSREKRLR
jgi:hypothetical protein